ncbi:MAG: hypothetical protein KDB24_15195, partial [Microthrixaceae bacterium]|nr:hypothetical protein [Microthrixaceae bacterium]
MRRGGIHALVGLGLLVGAGGACSQEPRGEDSAVATAASDTTAPDTAAPDTARCPTTVDADEFATAEELRDLLAEFNAFGLRSPASDAHEASLDWLAGQLKAVPGMTV